MAAAGLALAALLVIAAVLFAARPFLSERRAEMEVARDDADEEERVRLAEERDRALAALKELEFDHRTGKVSDADYRELVGPLRRQAADSLRALDRHGAEAPRAPAPSEESRV